MTEAERPVEGQETGVMPEQEKEQAPKPEAGIPADFDLTAFEILNPDEFTVENLIVQGEVLPCIKINEYLSATFRSLTMGELEELEQQVYEEMKDKSNTQTYNEMILRPTVRSIKSMTLNDKTVVFPENIEEKTKKMVETNLQVVNELVRAYGWVSVMTTLLVRKGDLKNF